MNDQPDRGTWIWLAVIAAVVVMRWQGCEITDVLKPPSSDAVACVYVHEKDKGSTPPEVQLVLDELNVPPFKATIHEVDTTNPNAQVPKQYEFAVPAAKDAGLPSLVWMAADRSVIKPVLKDPKTKAQVMESKP